MWNWLLHIIEKHNWGYLLDKTWQSSSWRLSTKFRYVSPCTYYGYNFILNNKITLADVVKTLEYVRRDLQMDKNNIIYLHIVQLLCSYMYIPWIPSIGHRGYGQLLSNVIQLPLDCLNTCKTIIIIVAGITMLDFLPKILKLRLCNQPFHVLSMHKCTYVYDQLPQL